MVTIIMCITSYSCLWMIILVDYGLFVINGRLVHWVILYLDEIPREEMITIDLPFAATGNMTHLIQVFTDSVNHNKRTLKLWTKFPMICGITYLAKTLSPV